MTESLGSPERAVDSLKASIGIKGKKDFYAGLIFVFFGLFAIVESRGYTLGTAANMGPGYFPRILGGILILFGLILFLRSLWSFDGPLTALALRPVLLVTIAVLAFALLLEPLGIVMATLVLVFISSLGGWQFRLREVAILYLGLVALAVGLFAYGLGLSFRVWPQW
jgi:hypothetical protein